MSGVRERNGRLIMRRISTRWKTSLSMVRPGRITVRGRPIEELMGNLPYPEALFLLLAGRVPSKGEARLFDAMLVSCIDHGTVPQSTTAARVVASAGSPLSSAVAAGILAVGERHGGAAEACARMLQEGIRRGESASAIVAAYRARGGPVPGYGHNIHTGDPRTKRLLALAEELGLIGPHTRLALDVLEELRKTKRVPLNVDGCVAALVSDMGFPWQMGKGFFILSRCGGLVAHACEEAMREKPLRVIHPDESEYDGQ